MYLVITNLLSYHGYFILPVKHRDTFINETFYYFYFLNSFNFISRENRIQHVLSMRRILMLHFCYHQRKKHKNLSLEFVHVTNICFSYIFLSFSSKNINFLLFLITRNFLFSRIIFTYFFCIT